jgi:hypothetical protein
MLVRSVDVAPKASATGEEESVCAVCAVSPCSTRVDAARGVLGVQRVARTGSQYVATIFVPREISHRTLVPFMFSSFSACTPPHTHTRHQRHRPHRSARRHRAIPTRTATDVTATKVPGDESGCRELAVTIQDVWGGVHDSGRCCRGRTLHGRRCSPAAFTAVRDPTECLTLLC